MVAQADDILVAAQAAGQVEERVHGIRPGRTSFREAVRSEQQAVLLRRERADVLQLQRVPDDHRAAGSA